MYCIHVVAHCAFPDPFPLPGILISYPPLLPNCIHICSAPAQCKLAYRPIIGQSASAEWSKTKKTNSNYAVNALSAPKLLLYKQKRRTYYTPCEAGEERRSPGVFPGGKSHWTRPRADFCHKLFPKMAQ